MEGDGKKEFRNRHNTQTQMGNVQFMSKILQKISFALS